MLMIIFSKEKHSMADLRTLAIKQMISHLEVQSDAAKTTAKIKSVRESERER